MIPSRKRRVGLMTQPKPGHFHGDSARRGLPAFETPCSWLIVPLFHGVGARPAYAATCRLFANCRNRPYKAPAKPAPIPLSSSSIRTGAGAESETGAFSRRASRSAFTASIWRFSNSMISSSRRASALRCFGSARPSPVCRSSNRSRRVLIPRLVPVDPLREEQALQPVHMTDALADESLQFPADTPAILLFRCWYANHRTDPWFAPFPRHERAHKRLSVDPVCLGAAMPARNRDRGWVNNVALDPFRD